MSKQNKPIIRTDIRKPVKEIPSNKKTTIEGKTSKENASGTKPKTSVVVGKLSNTPKQVQGKSEKAAPQTEKVRVIKRTDSQTTPKPSNIKTTTPRNDAKPLIKRTDSQVSAVKVTNERRTRASVPLKASHAVKVPLKSTQSFDRLQTIVKPSQSINNSAKGVATTKNVMNQIHNVTVSSPPPIRRQISSEETPSQSDPHTSLRGRTRTRTLEKDEIVFPNDQRAPSVASTVIKSQINSKESQPDSVSVEVKQPISFEVKFEDGKTATKPRVEEKTTSPKTETPSNSKEEEQDDYADDFDSYESDFESASVNSSESRKSSTSVNSSSAMGETSGDDSNGSDMDDAEVVRSTKEPIPKSQSQKVEEERQLDSGTFDLKPPDTLHTFHYTSAKSDTEDGQIFDEKDNLSETQNDSGIEYNLKPRSPKQNIKLLPNGGTPSSGQNNSTNQEASLSKDKSKSFEIKPRPPKIEAFYKRGNELMKKITLDTMSFVLFDFKPIAYEQFMLIYGRSNALQASVQTHNNLVSQECQTEEQKVENVWTQWPISYTVDHILSNEFMDCKRGFGRVKNKFQLSDCKKNREMGDCIKILNGFDIEVVKRIDNIGTLNVNHDDLNRFLQESLITISQINSRRALHQRLKETNMPMAKGYFSLETNSVPGLAQLQITNINTQPNMPNFLFSLHQNQKEALSFIAVWNVCEPERPLCLLSSWSRIVCFDIHSNMKGVVVAGLDDGSLAVWSFIEELDWHPKWPENERRYTPSHVVTPFIDNLEKACNDFGKVVSIKSVYSNVDIELLNGYNPTQVCSLHECGLLTLWTLMELSAFAADEIQSNRIDHQSAWSKVKLTQSKIIDLRQSIETFVSKKFRKRPKSGFEKTKSYFKSDLFNDSALQELQSTNQSEDKLLTKFCCVALEISSDGVFVATNENYLLFGRKSFKMDAFRKVQIDDDLGLRRHATSLVALINHGDDIILAGLNDGTIKAFRFNNSSMAGDLLSEDDESILSFSPLPSPQNPSASSSHAHPFNDFDNNNTMGKSCAIQNIVKGERQFQEEWLMMDQIDVNALRLPLLDRSAQHGDFHLMTSILNDQTIFSGTNLKTNLNNVIRRLIHLNSREQLLLLYGNRVMIYNLQDHSEILMNTDEVGGVCDVAAMTDDNEQEYLIILGSNNNIFVYVLTAEGPVIK